MIKLILREPINKKLKLRFFGMNDQNLYTFDMLSENRHPFYDEKRVTLLIKIKPN